MAQLDPFLNEWDERFHALVARNMLEHPFKPMLYTHPVLPYELTSWTRGHVWVHKQPLFLWQIALFFKLFGISELTLRLPGVLMMTGLTWLIFRLGQLTIHAKAGFYGALLFAVGNYGLELNSGVRGMDHNDMAFVFYVTASFWAWAEYERSGKTRWLVFIGLFSGGAVLNKWLTGLLVYSGWGLRILADKDQRLKWRPYLRLLFSLAITVAVFLPWQLYILKAFPLESGYEYSYNSRHFTEVLEGHGGSYWFHLQQLPELYGAFIAWSLAVALPLLWMEIRTRAYQAALFTWLLVTYLFFTLAATKINGYVYVACSVVYLAGGVLLHYALQSLSQLPHKIWQRVLAFLAVAAVAFTSMNLPQIYDYHTVESGYNFYWVQDYRKNKLHNTAVFRKLYGQFKGQQVVLFNVKPSTHVEAMFYTALPAYDKIPSEEEYQQVKAQQVKIAIFDNGSLPDYLQNDKEVIKLQEQLL